MASESDNLNTLIGLIRDVKPSLANAPITPDDLLVETLGLDSLDVVQLSRKVRRHTGPWFEPQTWMGHHLEHKYSIRSLLAAMTAPAVMPGAQVAAE